MSANHPCATSRCARTVWRCAAPLLMAILPATFTGLLSAQTQISSSDSLSEQLQAKLRRRGDLLLRDATLIEALFAIKENWGVNIVVGNEVKGAVNGAYTNAPLHEILDSILASQGYGYRVIGESLVITKLEHVGDWKPLFTTATLPLEHVPPEDVVDVIKFLLSPNGKAHAVPASKSVVVLDYADRIELVRTHLAKLDEAAAAAQTRAREEERRAAEDARREAQDNRAAPRDNTSRPATSQATPSSPPSNPPAGSANTGSATNAASPPGLPGFPSLAELLNSSGLATGTGVPEGIGAGASTLSRGAGTNVSAVPGLEAGDLDVAFFSPQFIQAASIYEALSTLVSEYGQVSIVPEENRIVAIDRPEFLKRIGRAVEHLDVPRKQVRISAMIFDASLQDMENVGVNWTHSLKGRNLGGTGAAQDQFNIGTVLSPTVGPTAVNGTMTLMSLSQNFDVTAVVNFLRTSNTSKLLADPTVTVLDQESAKIAIVTEIPYQQLTESAQGGTIGTTAFREAGVTLQVTPRIARDGTVTMLVTPQFSVLTGFTEEDNQPIIARREENTVVRVADQQTLVLGGLRQRGIVRNRAGIPGLADIKYIGPLFRQRSDEIRESELLVFITPTIVSEQHFGTAREQRAFETSRCELEQVKEQDCLRCRPLEDRTIYTNHDFSYTPVQVHTQPGQPSLSAPQSGPPPGSPPPANPNDPQGARIRAVVPFQSAGGASTGGSPVGGPRPPPNRLPPTENSLPPPSASASSRRGVVGPQWQQANAQPAAVRPERTQPVVVQPSEYRDAPPVNPVRSAPPQKNEAAAGSDTTKSSRKSPRVSLSRFFGLN